MEKFTVRTPRRVALVEVTGQVQSIVKASRVQEGLCVVFVPHTTAGVTVNENADRSVCDDIESTLSALIPRDGRYRHVEGNADAHVKSVLVGQSTCIPISGGWLALGTWQGVFVCEFDGPRTRTVLVKIIS